jgi:acyl-coenzyme A thioesterase PaaI-like protein
MSETPKDALSLQDRYAPHNACFGCGPANPRGLAIKSHVHGEEVLATWTPEAHHEAFPGMLNGGIIGALLDCHSNWTAAYALMRARGDDAPPCTVTADFHVKLLRPTPSAGPVTLRAHVAELRADRAVVDAVLEAGEQVGRRARRQRDDALALRRPMPRDRRAQGLAPRAQRALRDPRGEVEHRVVDERFGVHDGLDRL